MTKLNLGGINALSTCDTDGLAFSIFFQGCPFYCKGCHNPEFQSFNEGEITNTENLIKQVNKNLKWYDSVAFLGGEPLAQKEALIDLLHKTKDLGLTRWLYTGFEYEEIPQEVKDLCNVIVAGKYVEELKTKGFPASSNQTVKRRT